jgi:RHS repeat-associated protein
MLVAGQPAVSYGYDGADRLVQITQGSTSVGFVYDPNNHRTGLTLPNGVNVQYAFDQASHLTGTSYQLGTSTLGSLNYTYDSANRRMQTSGSFARTSLPQPVTSAVYDAANGLTQWNGTSLTYDAGGNMTSDGVTTYTWNMRNQVTSAGSASFQYDAFGRRVQNGRGIQFLYDGYNIVQEIMGTTPTANLLTGKTDEVFQRTDGSGTVTPLSEGAGTTVAMLDSTGAVRTQYTYDPYGRTTATGAATTNTVQYAGRENDGNDLYYYRARYYSTSLQRFINQDPAELTGGINRYTYALGGPTWLSDPSGADVTVVSYGGHAALAVGTDWPPIGFGPRDDQGGEFAAGVGILFGPYDPGVPGIVYPSDPNRPIQNWITIPTSPDQDTAIKNFMNRIHDNPPSYHVVGQSCVDFVEHALAAGGVAAPTNDLTPWGLVDDLQKMYPPPPSPADIDMGFTPVPPG